MRGLSKAGACNGLKYRCKECIRGALGGKTFKEKDKVGAWKRFYSNKEEYPDFCPDK